VEAEGGPFGAAAAGANSFRTSSVLAGVRGVRHMPPTADRIDRKRSGVMTGADTENYCRLIVFVSGLAFVVVLIYRLVRWTLARSIPDTETLIFRDGATRQA
jgi:hypothetical protein